MLWRVCSHSLGQRLPRDTAVRAAQDWKSVLSIGAIISSQPLEQGLQGVLMDTGSQESHLQGSRFDLSLTGPGSHLSLLSRGPS